MTGVRKTTIKSLSEEMEVLKEQVKEIVVLKQKVTELEKIVKDYQGIKNSDHRNIDVCKDNLKCKKCDKSFNTKKSLKTHMREIHPLKIQCKECEKLSINILNLKSILKLFMKQPSMNVMNVTRNSF